MPRRLTADEQCEFASAPDDAAGERVIATALCDYPESYYQEKVRAGIFQMTTISVDRKPAFRVYHFVSSNNVLYVPAAFGVAAKNNFSHAVQGVLQIARAAGCRGIEFNTERPGMIAVTRALGFVPCGVTLSLRLKND